MVDEVAERRIEFAQFLIIERGDFEAARAELDRAEAELSEVPDAWELRALQELRERGTFTPEDVWPIVEEAERQRREWLGLGGEG
jgi:hypothetical protein